MNDTKKDAVETLIENAAGAVDSADAMRFSQAAVNVANARCAAAAVQDRK